MSNLFAINKKNNKYINTIKPLHDKVEKYKYFPVSTREWNNSIYSFNKNTLSLIPISSKISSKLIKEYLKSSNFNIKYKLPNSYLTRKKKRLTSNRIYVSNGEFKHTSNKVTIVLYTYNREKYTYLTLLANRYLFYMKKKKNLKKKFFGIKTKSKKYLKKINKNKYNIIKKIKKENINIYMVSFYKKWLKKCMKIIKMYLYLKQLVYINTNKYNYTYLQILKNYVENVQNKKVEFNLINVKYNYLNSDILLKSITLKITKNRKKYKLFMNKPLWKIKPFKSYKLLENNYNNIDINKPLDDILKNRIKSNADLKKTALDNIKYKQVSGIRFQIAGRLTKRIKSARTIKTIKYKGNLKTESNNESKVILKGNLLSNLQYTKLKSKTRIGSFGIKGWISGN